MSELSRAEERLQRIIELQAEVAKLKHDIYQYVLIANSEVNMREAAEGKIARSSQFFSELKAGTAWLTLSAR